MICPECKKGKIRETPITCMCGHRSLICDECLSLFERSSAHQEQSGPQSESPIKFDQTLTEIFKQVMVMENYQSESDKREFVKRSCPLIEIETK